MLSFSSNSFAYCNPIPRLEPVTHTVTFVSASPGAYLLSLLLLLLIAAAAAAFVVVVVLVVFAPMMSAMTMRCVPNPFLLVELIVALLMREELLFPKPPKPLLLLMKAFLKEEEKEAAFVVKVVARISFCASSVPKKFRSPKKSLGCPNLTLTIYTV